MTISTQPHRVLVPDVAVVTPPAKHAVTVAEAKAHARIDHSADDTVLLPMLIAAATRAVEQHCRDRVFIDRVLDASWVASPSGAEPVVLPYRPAHTVASVTTYDLEGNATVLDPSSYTLDGEGRLQLLGIATWPVGTRRYAPFVVRFTAGYGTSETDVPEEAKVAVCIAVTKWYDERCPGPLPQGAKDAVAGLVGYRLRG